MTGNLPAGFTFVDNGNGTATINGVAPDQYAGLATYPLTIVATNSNEQIAVPFQITIQQAPEIISTPSTFTFNEGQTNTFVVTAVGAPHLFVGESGYVPGVTFVDNGNGTGTLSGTPPLGSGGVYQLTLFATDSDPTFAQQTLTLTIPEPPAFTSGSPPVFVAGRNSTYTITTTGYPTPSLYQSGALPSGLTFVDNGNGTATISGTPEAASSGVYPVTIAASSSSGTVTETIDLVDDPPLEITSPSTAAFSDIPGTSFGLTTNSLVGSVTFSETGTLPAGITFDLNTGTITGSSSAIGNYPIVVTAQSDDGQTSPAQNLTLTVGEAPTLSPSNQFHVTFYENQSGSVTFTATGFPAGTFTETGALPSGVTFVDNSNGTATLSGTPATGDSGTYFPQISVQNEFGSSGDTVVLSVLTLPEPVEVTALGGHIHRGPAWFVHRHSNRHSCACAVRAGRLAHRLDFRG